MDKRVIDLIRTQIPEPNLAAEQNPLLVFLSDMKAAFDELDVTPVVPPVVDSVEVQYDESPTPPTLADSDSPAEFTAVITYDGTVGTGAVTWSVTDVTGGGTATIDSNGVVTFSGVTGFTVVAVSDEDTDISGSLAVTVTVEVDSVEISGDDITGGAMTYTVGSGGVQLTADVSYSSGSGDGEVTWSLGNDSGTGATIVDGLFNATTAGTVTVIATSVEDGTKTASVEVTVSE